MKTYQRIAELSAAIRNCEENGNCEWRKKHGDNLDGICREYLPSGSGFDAGTKYLREDSNDKKLVFLTEFHHMDEFGGYSGWTAHKVTVTPAFDGVCIRVSGPNRDDIRDYVYETFYHALNSEVAK